MRRPITQIGQSILEWLFTRPAQDNMVALAKLSSAILGTSTQFSGLAVGPTSPASLQVSVAPGEIYMLTALEGTAYGTLPADTTHQIVKQGINLDAVLLTIAAPSVAGQSINYLIQATFQETDISVDPTSGASPVVLPFYNDSNPTQPYSGPNNTGQTSSTFRQGSVVLSAKAGISATTGSQVTPSPDSGYVGIAVVTVANGQTTITSGNIAAYANAPAINSTLLGLKPVFGVPVQVDQAVSALQAVQFGQVSGVVGTSRNLAMNITTASATATLTADEVIVESAIGGLRYCVPNVNATINLATTGIGGMDTGSAPVSGYVAIYLGYNPNTGAAGLFAQNATSAKATEVYTGSYRPTGYTATALVSVRPTNSSGQLFPGTQVDRLIGIPNANILSTSLSSVNGATLSLSTAVPPNARMIYGTLSALLGSAASNPTSCATQALSQANSTNGVGFQSVGGALYPGCSVVGSFRLPLSVQQTMYYNWNNGGVAASVIGISISGYEI